MSQSRDQIVQGQGMSMSVMLRMGTAMWRNESVDAPVDLRNQGSHENTGFTASPGTTTGAVAVAIAEHGLTEPVILMQGSHHAGDETQA